LAAASVAALGALSDKALAQSIQSTQSGEMPTTGGMRPGPSGANPTPLAQTGAVPVSLHIDKAQVDAPVEVLGIYNGVMENPTGPWVVSWYKETAKLGQTGNAVIAGHVDYWNVGPCVFQHLADLQKDDQVQVTGDDKQVYTYAVDWQKLYQADNAPLQEIVGTTKNQSLTLITCGGEFDYSTGHYLYRTVVRAHRV
jgi:LPXTG-site transpeptidase (sortase) family protein